MRDSGLVRLGLGLVLVEAVLALGAASVCAEEPPPEVPATQSGSSTEAPEEPVPRRQRPHADAKPQPPVSPAVLKKKRPAGKLGPTGATTPPARLPAHSRDDTGKVAPIGLHGDSRIADADNTRVTDERVVYPIGPTLLDRAAANAAIEPPHFTDTPDETGPSMSLAPEGQTGPLSPPEANARRTPDEPPIPLAVAERLVPLPPSRTEPALGEEASAAPVPEPPAESGPRLDPAPPVPSPFTLRLDRVPELVTVDRPEDEPAPEVDVLTLIRREIKQRLPYFQGCAQAAQRRNGMEVRRLQATWAIAADGSIKDMKLDGVADTQLAACIVRVGSRPFMVQPGLELVVPTPIVFVR